MIKFSAKTGDGYWVTVYHQLVRGKRLPIVIFGGGTMCWRGWYSQLAAILANNGFICIEYSQTPYGSKQPEDWIKVIESIIVSISEWPRISRIADRDRIGVAGHSMAAVASLLLNTCWTNVKAQVLISPGCPKNPEGQYIADASLYVRIPTLIVVGTEDRITGVEASQKHFDQIPIAEKAIDIFPGANHLNFINKGFVGAATSLLTSIGLIDGKATISHRSQIGMGGNAMVNWFTSHMV